MTNRTPAGPVLARRALNRALLARQHLLTRAPMATLGMVEHLVGMQAQEPLAPYVGLWSRVEGFATDDLGGAIQDRTAVRIGVMRGTLHLLTGRDALTIWPLMLPVARRGWASSSPFGRMVEGMDIPELLAAGRATLEERPRTTAELGAALAARWPERDPSGLAYTIRYLLPIVQVPPRGVWGKRGRATWTTVEAWLGRPVDPEPSIDEVVRRYLAAFGPATVADIQAWCWLTRLGEVVERLRPGLVTFRDERGRELFDLPDAPRPDPATAAPVRFVPPYDNIALSHADRSRIVADSFRTTLFTRGGVLVDGFIRGHWAVERATDAATLRVEPFEPLGAGEEADVQEEGRRLLAFVAADAPRHDVQVGGPPDGRSRIASGQATRRRERTAIE